MTNHISKEKILKPMSGMLMLIITILAVLISLVAIGFGIWFIFEESFVLVGVLFGVGLVLLIISSLLSMGLKILKPNEALVLTLFGKYHGTLQGDGFFFVNPFARPVNTVLQETPSILNPDANQAPTLASVASSMLTNKRLSLKAMTLSNDRQKINDQLGNPIIIGIVVIWRIVDTAKAVFNVDNFKEYLSTQCDSALRNVVRLYPYDTSSNDDNEKSLRGSSQEVADRLKEEIQAKVEVAGLEVIEAKITHLSYAQEIAAVMLQRQQASAIIDAKQMIVEGAVGMVEMAISKLKEGGFVQLDEERKAQMVSNLLVVLCGNKDAQPVVNSGTLY